MEMLKKALQVIAGIVFWAIVIDWVFLDGYYNPFIDLNDKPAAVAMQHVQTGISIFASTEEPGRKQQLHFSGNQPRKAAIATASKNCSDHIASSGGDFVCEEVSFFSQGCFVRYRLGNGNYPALGATQAEAVAKAKQKCESNEHTTPFSCVRDTNMCVDGGDNQGTRAWESGLVAISERFKKGNGETRVEMYYGRGSSLKAQRTYVEDKCRNITGQKCKTILTVTGDECMAVAMSGNGAQHWAYGNEQDKLTLKSEAQSGCTSKAGQKCVVAWKCAGMVAYETD